MVTCHSMPMDFMLRKYFNVWSSGEKAAKLALIVSKVYRGTMCGQPLIQERFDAACEAVKGKVPGTMRDLVKMPYAVIVKYSDGTKGTILMLNGYMNSKWAYAAKANGKTVATEFVLDNSMSYSHFSYLSLNIQKFIVTGKPTAPVERNLMTSGIIDMGIRSLAKGEVIKTPFLKIKYNVDGYEPIRPVSPRPTGQSIGPWPPKGYEFIIPEAFKEKK